MNALVSFGLLAALIAFSLSLGAAWHFGSGLLARWRQAREDAQKWKGLLK